MSNQFGEPSNFTPKFPFRVRYVEPQPSPPRVPVPYTFINPRPESAAQIKIVPVQLESKIKNSAVSGLLNQDQLQRGDDIFNDKSTDDFLRLYDFDFSRDMDDYLNLFTLHERQNEWWSSGAAKVGENEKESLQPDQLYVYPKDVFNEKDRLQIRSMARKGSNVGMIEKYKTDIDANVVQLHGRLDLSNFIQVPKNFYIVTFVRDDIVQYERAFASDVKKLSHGIAFYMITLWMLFLYRLTLDGEYDSSKNNLHDLFLNYYSSLDDAKKNFYDRLFPIYYTAGRMNVSSGLMSGRVSDYNIFRPGEIIPDMKLGGNPEGNNDLLVGITDVVSYYESQVLKETEDAIREEGFNFDSSSLYKDIKADLDLHDVYPTLTDKKKFIYFHQIIDYMQTKKSENSNDRPTFIFVNSCRVMDTGFKLLKLKPEKTILFHNILDKFQLKLSRLHHSDDNVFNYVKFYEDKKKLKEYIEGSTGDVSSSRQNRHILDIIFGEYSSFCIGSIERVESSFSNSVFLYYHDFAPEYATRRDTHLSLSTLLGVHLPFRNINGDLFDPNPVGRALKPGGILNASFLPQQRDFFIPFTDGGYAIMMYIVNYKEPFHPFLIHMLLKMLFKDDDQLLVNMINGWEDYAKEFFKPNIFQMVKQANANFITKDDWSAMLDIYGNRYRLFTRNKKAISLLLKKGYQKGFAEKYKNMSSFNDSIDTDEDGEPVYFPYLTFIEYFLANFMYHYRWDRPFFMHQYRLLLQQREQRTQPWSNLDLLLEISKRTYYFRAIELNKYLDHNFIGDFKTYARVLTEKNLQNFKMLDNIIEPPQSIENYYFELARKYLRKLSKAPVPATNYVILYRGYDVLLANYLFENNFDRYVLKKSSVSKNVFDRLKSKERLENVFSKNGFINEKGEISREQMFTKLQNRKEILEKGQERGVRAQPAPRLPRSTSAPKSRASSASNVSLPQNTKSLARIENVSLRKMSENERQRFLNRLRVPS